MFMNYDYVNDRAMVERFRMGSVGHRLRVHARHHFRLPAGRGGEEATIDMPLTLQNGGAQGLGASA